MPARAVQSRQKSEGSWTCCELYVCSQHRIERADSPASDQKLPVFGVPMNTHALEGKDSLLSILQMPAGIPVGTLAIGKPGAINAALLAAAIIAINRPEVRERLRAFRAEQTSAVLAQPDPAARE